MCNSIAPNVNRHQIFHTRTTVFSQIQSDLSQNEITLAWVNLWKVRFLKLKKKNKPTRNVMRIKKSLHTHKSKVPEHCKHRCTLQYTINALDHVLLMIQNLC